MRIYNKAYLLFILVISLVYSRILSYRNINNSKNKRQIYIQLILIPVLSIYFQILSMGKMQGQSNTATNQIKFSNYFLNN